jgi:hypothetical protein
MGGIFQGDVIIKSMIDRGLDDMRANTWLLEHAFSSLKGNPYIAAKYGQANISAAIEWFNNNKIDVYMRPRNDKDILPFVAITPGPTPEKPDMKLMADLSTETRILMPLEIGKPIPFVVKPFTPLSYNPSTGEVGIDENTVGFEAVSPGMVLVNPSNGNGYIIQNVEAGIIVIEDGLNIDATQLAVVPQFAYYEARIEHTFFQDSYTVECSAHGDPQTLIWLHTIVLYAILRYRESLLEASGFAESSVSSGELMQDPSYEGPGGEQAFVRMINLTGQIENSWIKAPRRFIETMVLKEVNCNEMTGGIKILSNFDAPPTEDISNVNWYTVADTEPANRSCNLYSIANKDL